MTDDDILRMAREAGGAWEYNRSHPVPCVMYDEELIRFARLVAAVEAKKHEWDIHSCGPTCERYACVARRKAVEAEREACAKVAERMLRYYTQGVTGVPAAIRARGERNEP